MFDLARFTKLPLVSYNEIAPASRYQVEGQIFEGEEDQKIFFLVPGTTSYMAYPLPDLAFEDDHISVSVEYDLSSINNQLPTDFMSLYACEAPDEHVMVLLAGEDDKPQFPTVF